MPAYRPVRVYQVLLGAATITLLLWGVAGGLRVLLQPGDIRPETGGPAEVGKGPSCERDLGTSPVTQPVKASDLIECPQLYDGQKVVYEGEVVRAILRRGDRAWVQVNDDAYALDLGPLPEHRTAVGGNSGIPVSIPAQSADQLRHVGMHQQQGDVIRVSGTFHRADPVDGGGPTIQAATVAIQRPGHRFDLGVSRPRAAVAALLALAVVLLGARDVWSRRA